LQAAGIIFQPYESIYVIAKRSEKVMINHQQYIYRKIKDDCLLNPIGLVQKNGVTMATPERAIADKIYLDGDEYFDNLRSINWELMKEINSRVYFNHSVINMFIKKNQP
jgi:hypothetical protein